MAVNALAAFGAGVVSAGLGYAAEKLGLGGAMWLLIIGPLALVLLMPSWRPAAK
jgi:hypothetical protein